MEIWALSARLSKILDAHIKRELLSMRYEIQKLLKRKYYDLQSLVAIRTSVEECRDYLMVVSGRMKDIGRYAVSGNYELEYFQTTETEQLDRKSDWAIRRLRVLVQKVNDDFATNMHKYGYTFSIGCEPEYDSEKLFVSESKTQHNPRL